MTGDDMTLVREFAASNSETAFTTLVERHLGLVHSAALRQTGGDAHLAEEIAQAVFIILARKAGSLGRKTILSGWLYQTVRLTAANYLRTEARRARREPEAFMQSRTDELQSDETWQRIAPLLDDALGRFGERDRNAIVLRFFENKNLSEVGAALGASEDAAKMRVNRSLEKLRKIFAKRGVTLTTALIAGVVSANSVQAAPVGLATLFGIAYGLKPAHVVFSDDLELGNTNYDVLITLPSQQKEALQEELKKQFGLTAHIETRKTDVLLLTIADPAKLQLYKIKGGGYRNYQAGHWPVHKQVFKDAGLAVVAQYAEVGKPVVACKRYWNVCTPKYLGWSA